VKRRAFIELLSLGAVASLPSEADIQLVDARILESKKHNINNTYHDHLYEMGEWTQERMDAVGELILHGRPKPLVIANNCTYPR